MLISRDILNIYVFNSVLYLRAGRLRSHVNARAPETAAIYRLFAAMLYCRRLMAGANDYSPLLEQFHDAHGSKRRE